MNNVPLFHEENFLIIKEPTMKRKGSLKLVGCTLAILFVLLTAHGVVGASDMPGADAAALWKYITKTSPYTEWDFWPGKDGMYKGTIPHGAYLKLFANKLAIDAAKAGTDMPNGAIIVKENYGEDAKTLMSITPMYKVKGYNPDGGDWFWAKYKADGSVEKSGKIEGCIRCHSEVKDRDWIYNNK